MTKEEWDKVQAQIEKSVGGQAKLKIDGYEVNLYLIPESTYKNQIAVYVNGYIKMEWCVAKTAEAEAIRKRFYSEHKKCCLKKPCRRLTKNEQAAFEKAKKECTYSYYLPYWSSFSSLKRHLIKNNNSIEIMEAEKNEYH